MKPGQTSVLAIDDDSHMARLMQRILDLEGYRVLIAMNGQNGLNLFNQEHPDVVVLDIMMPGMDGYEVCRRIREFSQTPIVMVTAKGDEEAKVRGLDAGADDYVTKPFSSRELVARVRAVLRRASLRSGRRQPPFQKGHLLVDWERHRVSVSGQEINLTATEYRLLSCLAQHAGRVLTPDQILEEVWGPEYCGETNLLQVNIARLRQRLGDNARKPKYILTRTGIGYTMPNER
ncbi:MAG: response regulator transcription factor [Chloroflexi bacterium]|nr:response regulator transcription factor [Chloroflexota bacterium]